VVVAGITSHSPVEISGFNVNEISSLFHGLFENFVEFFFFTWNLRRFKRYYSRKTDFSLLDYFENVGKEITKLKKQIEYFRSENLVIDEIYEGEVIETYNKVNEVLKSAGIGNNEPIGTIKFLHILSPNYFPLLDNPIAEQMGLKEKGVSVNAELYVEWMQKLKTWLENYIDDVKKLESKYGSSILKLVDEGFYIMCSVNLHIRVGRLGL